MKMCTTNNVIGCKCNATVLDGVHEQKWCFLPAKRSRENNLTLGKFERISLLAVGWIQPPMAQILSSAPLRDCRIFTEVLSVYINHVDNAVANITHSQTINIIKSAITLHVRRRQDVICACGREEEYNIEWN